jgi:hypothetical protein
MNELSFNYNESEIDDVKDGLKMLGLSHKIENDRIIVFFDEGDIESGDILINIFGYGLREDLDIEEE